LKIMLFVIMIVLLSACAQKTTVETPTKTNVPVVENKPKETIDPREWKTAPYEKRQDSSIMITKN
jgi:hypothetical protein